MIDPYYVSGYVDGEGSFLISFSPRKKLKSGLEVRPSFSVSQRKDRNQVLNLMKIYFHCGTIRFNSSDGTEKFEVRSLKDLTLKVIPHFKKYKLLSSKNIDFEKFCEVCEMMKRKEHFNKLGLVKIINLACEINACEARRYIKENLLKFIKI
jgi:hypothetical protein